MKLPVSDESCLPISYYSCLLFFEIMNENNYESKIIWVYFFKLFPCSKYETIAVNKNIKLNFKLNYNSQNDFDWKYLFAIF